MLNVFLVSQPVLLWSYCLLQLSILYTADYVGTCLHSNKGSSELSLENGVLLFMSGFGYTVVIPVYAVYHLKTYVQSF